mmetsp:Transcript_40876/g.39454  ORF Transcript_40876/g.39454 Transcript_40876/m.39454 type:complete len:178 (-) Transcript_40876:27-560(-)
MKKIILTKDVPDLGFRGEIVFVKPGTAFNYLVPTKKALFATDPDAVAFALKVDKEKLKRQQEERLLEVFLSQLKDIRIIFNKDVSELNKKVASEPVLGSEVLAMLNTQYNLNIQESDFKMDSGIDTLGEHSIQASFFSEQFQKEFAFYVKVVIKGKQSKGKKKGEEEEVKQSPYTFS